jgi:hypothetical protein
MGNDKFCHKSKKKVISEVQNFLWVKKADRRLIYNLNWRFKYQVPSIRWKNKLDIEIPFIASKNSPNIGNVHHDFFLSFFLRVHESLTLSQ